MSITAQNRERLEEIKSMEFDELLREQAKAELALELSINESVIDLFHNLVDPLERFYDPDNDELWSVVSQPSGKFSKGRGKQRINKFESEQDLAFCRDVGRRLADNNGFAQNALANRVAFTVGTGLTYQAVAKKSRERREETDKEKDAKHLLVNSSQDIIDEFIKRTDWDELEQELVEREDRDGEWFLRRFVLPSGQLEVRVIEPDEVSTPQHLRNSENIKHGIVCDANDAQTVTGYYINGELVPAEEIIHRKANVDKNVRRGISTLWSVRHNFKRAEKIQRNMSTVAAVQAALVAIRKFNTASQSKVQDFVDKRANVSYDPSFRQTTQAGRLRINPQNKRMDKWGAGTVLNMGAGQDLDFVAKGLDASKFIAVKQSDLRAIAARFNMPEFMLTADASNANFASTMVAEGPAHKQFQRLQAIYKKRGMKVIDWVLQAAISVGLLPENLYDFIVINVGAPALIVRDSKKEAEANETKHNAGVMSLQTWSTIEGLDYEQEQQNIADHNARFGGFTGQPLPPVPPEPGDSE